MRDKPKPLPEISFDLRYGLILATFGEEAVDKVVNQEKWAAKYPELINKVKSSDLQVRAYAILPAEIAYEIARQEECSDDYYADPDGERLYAVSRRRRGKGLSVPESQGYKKIPNQEAYMAYGPYCLFMASDRGVGYKGENGRPSDHGAIQS